MTQCREMTSLSRRALLVTGGAMFAWAYCPSSLAPPAPAIRGWW